MNFMHKINYVYNVFQKNGQRVIGPPYIWSGPPPKKGCEIFICRLPFDFYEDELLPLLEKYGVVYELRTMVNFDGTLRGFAFCKYANREQAQVAIANLNRTLIRNKIMIRATLSMEFCRLFIGKLDREQTRKQLFLKFVSLIENLIDVIMLPDPQDPSKNRGYAFLEFTDHRSAAIARRQIKNNREKFFDYPILIDWAKSNKLKKERN